MTRQKFLLKLSKALLSFGAPSHRITSQLTAAAEILGANAGMSDDIYDGFPLNGIQNLFIFPISSSFPSKVTPMLRLQEPTLCVPQDA